jgi:hypothetical protein
MSNGVILEADIMITADDLRKDPRIAAFFLESKNIIATATDDGYIRLESSIPGVTKVPFPVIKELKEYLAANPVVAKAPVPGLSM